MFIASCYFIYNARRDKATEKEFGIVIQMTLQHVLVQGFKKKEMDGKKQLLTKTCKCYKESKFLSNNDLVS